MNQIIDTHTFLWFISGSSKLTRKAKNSIDNSKNKSFISIASLWELSIKIKLGKLTINGTYESVIDDIVKNGFEILSINFAHTVENYKLEFFHTDPFDRIIIAQGLVEGMSIISCDEIFDKYLINKPIKRIW